MISRFTIAAILAAVAVTSFTGSADARNNGWWRHQNAAATTSLLPALAGKTCRANFDFGHWTKKVTTKGAYWFQPDATGTFDLYVRYGNVAKEAYKSAASSAGYENAGRTQLKGNRFANPKQSSEITLTMTGASTFKLYETTQSGNRPMYGEGECD